MKHTSSLLRIGEHAADFRKLAFYRVYLGNPAALDALPEASRVNAILSLDGKAIAVPVYHNLIELDVAKSAEFAASHGLRLMICLRLTNAEGQYGVQFPSV